MQVRKTGLILFALAAFAASSPAQWIRLKSSGIPRTNAGQPNLLAAPPRTAEGRPDFSGIWQIVHPATAIDEGQGRNGLRLEYPDLKVPAQPWAKALWDKRFDVDKGAGRPAERCLPHAITDALFHGMFKIVQTRQELAVLFEEFDYYRQIHLDGRSQPVDPDPAWFGYSTGSWQKDELVVTTQGIKIPSWLEYGFIDDSGIPYSDALKVTERFQRTSFGHLHQDVTIEDPKVFTAPWTYSVDFQLQPDTEMLENVCENEKDFRHYVAK